MKIARRPFGMAAVAVVTLFFVACGHDAARTESVSASTSGTAPTAPAPQVVVPPAEAAPPAAQTGGFDGAKAYDHVAKLVAFGPHPPASDAIRAAQDYIRAQLKGFGCAIEEDAFNAETPMGTMPMRNITAKIPGAGRGIILLMSHYDTKRVDKFVGAEDGGSSTGLMLEVARNLCGSKSAQPNAVWIAFLDGEETQAQFEWSDTDSEWGSRELAATLASSGDLKQVRAVILADMVGQRNLVIPREGDSTKWVTDLIWHTAARLGYGDVFVSRDMQVTDDHDQFLRRGVPAADVIDLDGYITEGNWHTATDTLDKISPRNLAIVGHVILESVKALQDKFR